MKKNLPYTSIRLSVHLSRDMCTSSAIHPKGLDQGRPAHPKLPPQRSRRRYATLG